MAMHRVRFQPRPDVPPIPMILEIGENRIFLSIDAGEGAITQDLAHRYLTDLHIALFLAPAAHGVHEGHDVMKLRQIDAVFMTPDVAEDYLFPYLPDFRNADPLPGVH